MDTTQIPHTFVRTVKAQDLCFNQVDDVLENIKANNSPTWVILAFAVRTFMRFGSFFVVSASDSVDQTSSSTPRAPRVLDVYRFADLNFVWFWMLDLLVYRTLGRAGTR